MTQKSTRRDRLQGIAEVVIGTVIVLLMASWAYDKAFGPEHAPDVVVPEWSSSMTATGR